MDRKKRSVQRSVQRNKYGSLGEVDKTKKDGTSKVKEIAANTDGTGTIRKYKYDSEGMEKPGGYKKRNISAKKAERKIKRIEKKANSNSQDSSGMYKKGGSVIKGKSLRRSRTHKK